MKRKVRMAGNGVIPALTRRRDSLQREYGIIGAELQRLNRAITALEGLGNPRTQNRLGTNQWKIARDEWNKGTPTSAIALRLGVTAEAVRYHAQREKWTPRSLTASGGK